MDHEAPRGEPTKDGEGNPLFIGIVFVLGYVFAWQLTKGADFFSAYTWYWRSASYTAEVIGLLLGISYAIQKRWPRAFEKPPKFKEGTALYGGINVAGGVIASLVGFLLDGGWAAALAFWPGIFAACGLQHAAYWVRHQVKYWRRIWLAHPE